MTHRPIRMILLLEALEAAVASGDGSPVYGTFRADEHLIQGLSLSPDPGRWQEIGCLRFREPAEHGPSFSVHGRSFYLDLAAGIPSPDAFEVLSALTDMESRRVGLVPEEGLSGKTVALLGAGSIGSQVGLLLAEAGVGRFVVVDRDHLDPANLSRHACDLAALGRAKSVAVADLLRRRLASVEPVVADILEMDEAKLDEIVGSADLVVATTDSPACQFVVNETCLRTETPGLFVGAYERACGGEIVLVQPGESPCLYCAVGFRAGVSDIAPQERRQAYQAADANRLVAEPGLGADIAYLSAVASAYALAALDPTGMRASLTDPEQGFVLIHSGSAPQGSFRDLFQGPFDLVYGRVEGQASCPVCGWVREKERVG